MRALFCSLASLLLTGCVLAAPAAAEVSSFYKGNTIKIVVGFGPGGGVDIYSRMLARHMGSYIPGNPNIIVENMPGAGTMRAVQSLQVSPKDGTYIVAFNPGNVTNAIIDPGKVKFPFKDIVYLGSLSAETQVCYMWSTRGVETFDEFLARPNINMGATSNTDSEYMIGALVRNLFGAHIHFVLGYTSKPEINTAIERGELDGGCGSFDGVSKDWVSGHKIDMIIRLTKSSPPGVPQLPYIMDLATPEQQTVMKAILDINDMFRPYIIAKGVPAERVEALRSAFYRTVTSAAFLEEAEHAGREVQHPLPGADVARMVDEMLEVSPQTIVKMKAAIR